MTIGELFQEIFERYPQEYQRDNKVSNPYYKDLKQRIEQVFQPFIAPFGFEINALGGQDGIQEYPYICFLAEGHCMSRGFFPIYSFNFERKEVFGNSDMAMIFLRQWNLKLILPLVLFYSSQNSMTRMNGVFRVRSIR